MSTRDWSAAMEGVHCGQRGLRPRHKVSDLSPRFGARPCDVSNTPAGSHAMQSVERARRILRPRGNECIYDTIWPCPFCESLHHPRFGLPLQANATVFQALESSSKAQLHSLLARLLQTTEQFKMAIPFQDVCDLFEQLEEITTRDRSTLLREREYDRQQCVQEWLEAAVT